MKKLYEKNEVTFAVVWIVIYCVLQSLSFSLNEEIGIEFSASAVFCIIQAVIIFVFIKKNGLSEKYGLCKPSVSAGRFLFYVPLIILATGGLWRGVAANYPLLGIVCHFVGMVCVGFIEEVIFRGFLFKAMAKKNVKSAIIVSSVTFGIGHIVNLFNDSGMDLLSNIIQICFAVAVGFLFVIIFYRGGSLLPCIFTHSAINSLNTFANGEGYTVEAQIIHVVIMLIVTVAYVLILTRTLPKAQKDNT